jgi:hypothetical protein
MRATMTIREIRKAVSRLPFDTQYDVTINTVEFTNQQALDFLCMFDNQDKVLEVITFEITNIFAISIVD